MIAAFSRALFFLVFAGVAATSGAGARCTRPTFDALIQQFKVSRDVMQSQPDRSYSGLRDLQLKLTACIQAEKDKQLRFKLALFETGLESYIGAADAARGHVARGRATAQAAMRRAKNFVRENQTRPTYLQLAQQLVVQCQRPLRLIDEMPASRNPKP